VNKTNRLRELTLDCFGTELGSHLLDKRAILTVVDKVCRIQGWQYGLDPDAEYGSFNGLAVLNGPESGMTTIDIDTAELLPPVQFNVRTARGGHIYPVGQAWALDRVPHQARHLGEGLCSLLWPRQDISLTDSGEPPRRRPLVAVAQPFLPDENQDRES
jgi:hypothetical protein